MKSILLASASIVAFAGAAAAEVTFSGEAELGYNTETDDGEGFYWSADLAVTLSQVLNNGLTASVTADLSVADNNEGDVVEASGLVISLTSETAGLYFGDTGTAADTHWVSAGSMAADGFTSGTDLPVLRGDITYGGIAASISYLVDEGSDSLEQLSVGAAGSFGNFNFAVAYQEAAVGADGNGDFSEDGIFGVSVGTTFGGADVRLAYAKNDDASGDVGEEYDSIGIEASYPVGPVTLGAYYVIESTENNKYGISADYASGPITVGVNYEDTTDGEADWSVEGTYDVGNGIMVLAGLADAGEDYYVAGTVDLGEGSTLGLAYAEDGDGDADDEIGGPEYKNGATVWVSFAF